MLHVILSGFEEERLRCEQDGLHNSLEGNQPCQNIGPQAKSAY